MLNEKEREQKEALFSDLKEKIDSGKLQTAKTLEPGAIITCLAVEDGDYQEINRFWDNEGNKSYPRDLNCSICQRQVMLSNWMFAEYQKNLALGEENKILCGKCLLEKIKREKV